MSYRTCTNLKYCKYDSSTGTWSDWSSKLANYTTGTQLYQTCIQFKIPNITDCLTRDSKLSFKIPFRRASASTGNISFLFKLRTPDSQLTAGGTSAEVIDISTATTTVIDSSGGSNTELEFSISEKEFLVTPGQTYCLYIGTNGGSVILGTDEASSCSITYDYTPYTLIEAGSVEIIDNYNNTFTIKATAGKDGTNNPVKELSNLNYGYTSTYTIDSGSLGSYTSGEVINLAKSGVGNTRTVFATATSVATYGESKKVTASRGIRQYIAPQLSGMIDLIHTKNRLTLKEHWTFKWRKGIAANETSKIAGYRIRLFRVDKFGTETKVQLNKVAADPKDFYFDTDINSTDNTLLGGSYTEDADFCYFTIDPVAYNFSVGESVKLTAYAYTRYGLNNDDPNSYLFSTAGATKVMMRSGSAGNTGYAVSNVSEVFNAGTLGVFNGSDWVEGQILIYTSSGWVEAESLNTYTAEGWKESV